MIGRRGSPETRNMAVGGSGSSLSRPEQTAGTSSKKARSETACWCLRTWASLWRLAAELSRQPLEGRIHLSILVRWFLKRVVMCPRTADGIGPCYRGVRLVINNTPEVK